MTPKPPDGFATWLDYAMAELAALRARIAELEQQVAALADALDKCCDTISEWYVQDREGVETVAQARLLAYLNVPALSKARNLLANMKEQAALRAAGRKT